MTTRHAIVEGLARTGIVPAELVTLRPWSPADPDPWPVDRTHTPPSVASPGFKR